ncbi:hypothetical protein [Herbaspirillum aquaticum]|uniref:Uncharacterized protein n=1 Tax=Herbaspirillum aquaticum TaxID=568783 RepID=A0A225SL73_9BURK|nr:hypothetical protein [Herbaspirillum aquaticum]OWY31741.1 hypothetical protein CEJ45_24280 [Herbaspirillum aquaticum]
MSSHENNPWAKQAVTIYLSPDRRGKLADYASCADQQMTPAETIYALIDTASSRDIEEDVSLSEVKSELKNLRTHIDDQKKIIQECTHALHVVSQTLEVFQGIIRHSVATLD